MFIFSRNIRDDDDALYFVDKISNQQSGLATNDQNKQFLLIAFYTAINLVKTERKLKNVILKNRKFIKKIII